MNPLWKKAKWDVVPKEDLEAWYAVEQEIIHQHYQGITEIIRRLAPLYQPDGALQNQLLDDEESWGDPQEEEFANLSGSFMNAMSDICSWDLEDFIEMEMLCDRIWASSMNQVLDEDVDCSGESNFNLNELMYGARSLS